MTETMMAEEDFNAGDKCGRCGCKRREHTPVCTGCTKCKSFSKPKEHKPKPKKRR